VNTLSVQTRQQAYWQGAKDAFPSIVGLIPFGLIVGTASTAAGMDPWLALAMSLIVYAGASQLAAIGLMTQSAPVLIVIATVLVVNLRFVMYSASLAPFFRHLRPARKWLLSYGLTDHLFALVMARFNVEKPDANVDAYFLGGAIPTWLTWNLMVAIGIFAGTLVPKAWSLDFAIPLVFLALVFPALTSRAHWTTAGVAAIAAFFTAALPMKLGLIAAAVTGVVVGSWLDARREAKGLA
jgi:4-azaleucine resistance transporter AzlC